MLRYPCYHCSLVLKHACFCDLVITPNEARSKISVSAIKVLNKPDGIAEKWSKVNLDKIKNLDAPAEDYEMIQILLQQRSLKGNQCKSPLITPSLVSKL